MRREDIKTGEQLVDWFCETYPVTARMAASTCLSYELKANTKLLDGCPIAHWLENQLWRDYVMAAVIDHYGERGMKEVIQGKKFFCLSELYLWRIAHARHPEWGYEFTQEWEDYYAKFYHHVLSHKAQYLSSG